MPRAIVQVTVGFKAAARRARAAPAPPVERAGCFASSPIRTPRATWSGSPGDWRARARPSWRGSSPTSRGSHRPPLGRSSRARGPADTPRARDPADGPVPVLEAGGRSARAVPDFPYRPRPDGGRPSGERPKPGGIGRARGVATRSSATRRTRRSRSRGSDLFAHAGLDDHETGPGPRGDPASQDGPRPPTCGAFALRRPTAGTLPPPGSRPARSGGPLPGSPSRCCRQS
jgi:hypothetical protein